MQIINADFRRRIDLPGAGPCPRPVDIDQGVTGFSDLVSLRIYAFASGMTIEGEAEEDEVFMVVMRGAANVAVHVGGILAGEFPLAESGGSRVLYMPPLANYQLTANTDVDVAYARVRPSGATPAASSFPTNDAAVTVADYASAMNLTISAVEPGGTVPLGRDVESLVHVRADDGGSLAIDGRAVADWQTAAVGPGEQVTLTVENATIDVLTISARG